MDVFTRSTDCADYHGIASISVDPLDTFKRNFWLIFLKKTDKEDALNLAKFIQRYPKEELSLVSLSAEQEE